MAKIKQSPKLPAEQRRRQLLAAARSLFLKKGFRGTTTEEIARKAGLTKGAIYFHFKNKEDILSELLKLTRAEFKEAIQTIPEGTGSPAFLLQTLLERKCIDSSADFASYLDFWLQAWKIPKIRKEMIASMEGYDEAFAKRIDPAFAATRSERRELTQLIFALYNGMMAQKILQRDQVSLTRQVRLFQSLTEGKTTTRSRKQR